MGFQLEILSEAEGPMQNTAWKAVLRERRGMGFQLEILSEAEGPMRTRPGRPCYVTVA
jgi:hypothetical protein